MPHRLQPTLQHPQSARWEHLRHLPSQLAAPCGSCQPAPARSLFEPSSLTAKPAVWRASAPSCCCRSSAGKKPPPRHWTWPPQLPQPPLLPRPPALYVYRHLQQQLFHLHLCVVVVRSHRCHLAASSFASFAELLQNELRNHHPHRCHHYHHCLPSRFSHHYHCLWSEPLPQPGPELPHWSQTHRPHPLLPPPPTLSVSSLLAVRAPTPAAVSRRAASVFYSLHAHRMLSRT
mmetsp:Transcript_12931/g.22331  ORF Transcript_12931/g.22331 Transcript_12931/m.22331 type:complete len:232 (-) Transcript_12931:1022-1717(-)